MIADVEEAEEAIFKTGDVQNPADTHRSTLDPDHSPSAHAIGAERMVMCQTNVGLRTKSATTATRLGTSSPCAGQHLHQPM